MRFLSNIQEAIFIPFFLAGCGGIIWAVAGQLRGTVKLGSKIQFLIFAMIFMAGWRSVVSTEAQRYNINLIIPMCIMSIYALECLYQWIAVRNTHWAFYAALGLLCFCTAVCVCKIVLKKDRRTDTFLKMAQILTLQSSAFRRPLLLDSSKHGARILHYCQKKNPAGQEMTYAGFTMDQTDYIKESLAAGKQVHDVVFLVSKTKMAEDTLSKLSCYDPELEWTKIHENKDFTLYRWRNDLPCIGREYDNQVFQDMIRDEKKLYAEDFSIGVENRLEFQRTQKHLTKETMILDYSKDLENKIKISLIQEKNCEVQGKQSLQVQSPHDLVFWCCQSPLPFARSYHVSAAYRGTIGSLLTFNFSFTNAAGQKQQRRANFYCPVEGEKRMGEERIEIPPDAKDVCFFWAAGKGSLIIDEVRISAGTGKALQ